MLRSAVMKSSPDARGRETDLIERIQSYMRLCAERRYEVVRIPPFTAYFHPFDTLVYLNYAIPDARAGGDVRRALVDLRAVFRARERVPRFEYIAELAPDLASALEAAGFRTEAEARLMACTRATFTPCPTPDGVSISILTPESPLENFLASGITARLGFGSDPSPAPFEEAQKTRADLADGRSLLARVGGEPVAVGVFSSPEGGLSELAGIATLPAFRGRGIGAAIVSRAAEEAFQRGIDTLFLSTITEEAGRLYERVGFRFITTMLFTIESAEGSAAGAT